MWSTIQRNVLRFETGRRVLTVVVLRIQVMFTCGYLVVGVEFVHKIRHLVEEKLASVEQILLHSLPVRRWVRSAHIHGNRDKIPAKLGEKLREKLIYLKTRDEFWVDQPSLNLMLDRESLLFPRLCLLQLVLESLKLLRGR